MNNDSISRRADENRPVMAGNHPEIYLVEAGADHIACSGGGQNSGGKAAGHPKVYYTFQGQDNVVCGYCDRLFTKVPQAGAKVYSQSGV